jgi:hypothetical protein
MRNGLHFVGDLLPPRLIGLELPEKDLWAVMKKRPAETGR